MNGKKLRRSTSDRIFAGVCGGIAEFFGISSLAVRVLFVVLGPLDFLLYIILAVIIPEE
ncbi:phage shock protein C (PspC) family protein [Alkalibacterium subtropicum]|uniref:Phage shock protein C (PspC) family protein n=1 Tax=Alkalibacterium subtropicum TaxID=753702 RepID=A0A1I1GWC9_9LACT|nr:PspC domain-containing protein [Alkalibacterium subtropicum]SFC16127.1 phage shock protein C (PspC) family protein [Alkalibacterium subtropicum]